MTFAELELGDKFSFKGDKLIKCPVVRIGKYRKNALILTGKNAGTWVFIKHDEVL